MLMKLLIYKSQNEGYGGRDYVDDVMLLLLMFVSPCLTPYHLFVASALDLSILTFAAQPLLEYFA
jgi:hypothetical protein